MSANHYGAVLASWKSDLIVARARRMGLSGHELYEAQQELVLHVAAFRHEAARSNGASEVTALTAVIDRRLRMLHRAETRYDRRQQHARALRVRQNDVRSDLDRHLLAVDVREATARLTPEERHVCQLLGQGKSVTGVAEMLQCSWHTAKRIIERIRTKFRDRGLDGWIIDR